MRRRAGHGSPGLAAFDDQPPSELNRRHEGSTDPPTRSQNTRGAAVNHQNKASKRRCQEPPRSPGLATSGPMISCRRKPPGATKKAPIRPPAAKTNGRRPLITKTKQARADVESRRRRKPPSLAQSTQATEPQKRAPVSEWVVLNSYHAPLPTMHCLAPGTAYYASCPSLSSESSSPFLLSMGGCCRQCMGSLGG